MASELAYSFDVFDTVLTRVLSRPVDVFLYVQKRIQGNNQYPQVLLKKFVSARVWAEFKCRRLTSAQDVSLKDIYDLMRADYQLTAESTLLLFEEELRVESICLVPIPPIIDRVCKLHEEGYKIIFVSDMYLPAEFIQSQLEKHGVFHDGDHLYVSGDLGITKGSGKLFRHVLKNEGLAPENLIHCGDNHHSDSEIPSEIGVLLDPLTRGNGPDGYGLAPGLRAKFHYAATILRARANLGINRVV